jgi:hypothetical protein
MSTEMALAEAKAFLGECAFVGIAEQMAASTARLARVLKIVNVPIVSRQNVDPKRASMDASRFEMHPGIEDILWADWELYRFALDRFASHA